MNAITLAFTTSGNKSDSTCLYSGPDAALALEIAQAVPAGFHHCEVYVNPIPRKRVFGIPEAAAPDDPSAPSAPSDKPDKPDKTSPKSKI